MQKLAWFFLVALAARAVCAQPAGQTLSIAAAADLVYCLKELNQDFARQHPGVDVKVSIGSSGNFFAQIQKGAPFDGFLSADLNFPKELVRAGLADGRSLLTYAVGRIVVWTVNPAVDVSRGLAVVSEPAVRKFAIANPGHAPYGRAAKAALEHEGLWASASGKIVMGENIAQTGQFIQTGNADAGIVAMSLVLSPALEKVGTWKEIPPEFYPKLEQGAVITAHGAGNPAAQMYFDFLRSKEARAVFDRYGFRLPK
jgi:molybdate transport system substrate-binding protein